MEQQQLIDNIFNSDDISWQSMIFEAVRSEEMDPWDVDIAQIAERFMHMLSEFKERSLQIPGKVILASAILLKLKSRKFVEIDIEALDRLIAYTEGEAESWEEDDGDFEDAEIARIDPQSYPVLVPRTPQPRKRKVSVYDLVKALEKAIEVKNRRKVLTQRAHPKVELPNKIFDLSFVLNDVYNTIVEHHEKVGGAGALTFSQIIPQDGGWEDKVYTFIPLLHLCNMRKIDLHQEQHFSDFEIELLSKQKNITKEIDVALGQQAE
jgi:segregation and condensation protein A